MIGSVGGGNSMLALLQARTAKAQSATEAPKRDKETEAAKAAEAKRLRSEDLLRTLRQINTDGPRQRKAAAAQKVERLKKELESLRMFSGGDPKAIARQAARIARELGAAAKEYSSAGGGSAPVGGASPSGDAASATATVTAGADAGGSGDAAADQGVKAAQSEAAKVTAEAQAKAGGTDQHAKTDKDGKPLSPEDKRAAFVDKLNSVVAEMERRGGEKAADKKFETEIRNLFNQAKALVEQQRRRAAAEKRGDKELDQFAKDVAEAGRTIEQAFSGAGMDMGIAMVQGAVNITV